MSQQFYDLAEACEKMGQTEDELKQLVRDGQLREFRDGGQIKYKAEEVDMLAENLATLSGSLGGTSGELIFEPSDESSSGLTGSDMLTLEEADVMLQAAERNGMQLAVNVKHSFEPRIRKIREMVVSEELGKLRMLNYWYFNDWLYSPRTAEELTPELGGGVPWRQGPHQFDILRTIAGGLVRTVRATTGVWDETRPVPGCYSSFLEFENGVVATAVYSGYDHFNSRELTYRVDEGDAWPDPPVHAKARTALREAGSKEAETAMKRDRRFGGSGRDPAGAAPGQRRPTPWILGGPLVVSFDKGDVRLTPNGLMVYGEEEKWEIPLPSLPDGRDGIIDEVYQAVVNGRRPSNDGHWGKATLEVVLALFQSGKERREIQMSHQVPTQD